MVRVKAAGRLEKDSDLLIDQIRTMNNKRFSEGTLLKCDETLIKSAQESVRDIIEALLELDGLLIG